MSEGPNIAIIGQLLGDPARIAMLQALMSGRALTATELANSAAITPQTASTHLAKLTEANLLVVQRHGRHRYHRLANSEVADLIEKLMNVADRIGARHLVTGPKDPAMRRCRVCYDHLAGATAVRFFAAAVKNCWLESHTLPDESTTVTPTGAGLEGLARLGVDVTASATGSRPLSRACMDWSERRHHLAGVLGTRLLDSCLEQRWATRTKESRVLLFTARGERALFEVFL